MALVTHVFLNGQCREAVELYCEALHADVEVLIPELGNEALVRHAEIAIHGQKLMLNDFGGGDERGGFGGYQLVVSFESEKDLRAAYCVMKEGSVTVSAMQATDYSPCVVRFADRFGVHWAFMV